MHLLSVENLRKQFGMKILFEDASFILSPGERAGLVGVNGSGKTTLLRMLAGEEPPDGGTITFNPRARLAYLPQNPTMEDELTSLDYLYQGNSPTMQLLRDYKNVIQALTRRPGDPTVQQRLMTIDQRMDRENGWAAEASAKAILTRLGISDFETPLGRLSGGQRRRVALARVLLDPADLLILDEPTNHLDPETIIWLETHLADLSSALLMITHDRYILDRVVERILEISDAQIFNHPGNYSRYLEIQAAREETNQKLELDRRRTLEREIEWLNRTPMARGGKQKARIQRANALLETRYTTHQQALRIDVASRRTGKQIMDIRNISKQFAGQTVVDRFSYTINRQARLGFVGPNGSGKTTLLNMLAGRLEPDGGEIITGTTIHIGYYDQESQALDEDQRIIDYISDQAEVIRTAAGGTLTAAQMLERFLFPRRLQYDYIGVLSGGERRRLYLLRTLMMAPNFLLLDEPTNDLDIQTLSILENYLDGFDGVLIVVSHDRYFLDRTVEYIFAFEGQGRIKQYPGNYSAYRARKAALTTQESNHKPAKPTPSTAPPQQKATKKRRLSYKETAELAQLESRIMEMETAKEKLAVQINAAGGDYQQMQALTEDLLSLEARLDAAMERWAELAELAE